MADKFIIVDSDVFKEIFESIVKHLKPGIKFEILSVGKDTTTRKWTARVNLPYETSPSGPPREWFKISGRGDTSNADAFKRSRNMQKDIAAILARREKEAENIKKREENLRRLKEIRAVSPKKVKGKKVVRHS